GADPAARRPSSTRAGACRVQEPPEPPSCTALGKRPNYLILIQSFSDCSAGCRSSPRSTLRPRTSAASPRQSPEASRSTHGRIAALIACDAVLGTAPGMLVTQKWATPSSTNTGSCQVVGREVSKQPPWSIAMSTITLPG